MSEKQKTFVFNRSNYILLLVGIGLNILGFLLMIGGAAETQEAFNEADLFSHIRITLSPILIVLGYIVIIFSIMKKPKTEEKKDQDSE
jgi:uncharacterized membrane protein